jgi:hypothetical protein
LWVITEAAEEGEERVAEEEGEEEEEEEEEDLMGGVRQDDTWKAAPTARRLYTDSVDSAQPHQRVSPTPFDIPGGTRGSNSVWNASLSALLICPFRSNLTMLSTINRTSSTQNRTPAGQV